MTRFQEMQKVLARCEESGQSLRAFSQREGISLSKLSYWRRKLRGAGTAEDGARSSSKKSRWVAVRVVPHGRSRTTDEPVFEVRFGNGLGVRVAAGFDESELRRLIAVLVTC
jgi:hypothetical protein